MVIKAIVTQEEFDQLPTEVQEHFTQSEKGDSYGLGVETVGGMELADIGGLKKALASERDIVGKTEKELGTIKSLFEGIDAESARDAMKKVEEMADWDPEQKLEEAKSLFMKQHTEKSDSALKKVVDKHAEKEKLDGVKIKSLLGQLNISLVRNEAMKAIAEAGGSAELLLPHVESQTRMVEKDDKYQVVVVEPDGTERLSTDVNNNGPMSIAELITEFKGHKHFGRAFVTEPISGSGAVPSHKTRGGAPFTISSEAALDTAQYERAKENAAKAGRVLEIVD